MNDSRLENARILIAAALKTGDETHMKALLWRAQKIIRVVLEEF